MDMHLIYKTDAWHSYSSRDIIGLASSKEIAITICKQQAEKEHETIDEDQLFNLNHLLQTQSYSGEGEFQIECIAIDTLV